MDENENLYTRTRSSGSMLNLKRIMSTIKLQKSWLGVILFAYDAVRVTHKDPALEVVTFYCAKASGLISLSIYLKKTVNLLHPIMTKLDFLGLFWPNKDVSWKKTSRDEYGEVFLYIVFLFYFCLFRTWLYISVFIFEWVNVYFDLQLSYASLNCLTKIWAYLYVYLARFLVHCLFAHTKIQIMLIPCTILFW